MILRPAGPEYIYIMYVMIEGGACDENLPFIEWIYNLHDKAIDIPTYAYCIVYSAYGYLLQSGSCHILKMVFFSGTKKNHCVE